MNGLLSNYGNAMKAAQNALIERKFEAAGMMLENALRYASDPSERASVQRALGHAQRMVGNLAQARAELESAEAVAVDDRDALGTGVARRQLAEVAYDRAQLLTSDEDVREREDLLDLADSYVVESYEAMLYFPLDYGLELDATRSITGALQFERGNIAKGLGLLRRATMEFKEDDNEASYLIVNSLRLMRYSPIDRWKMFRQILRLISQNKELYRVYRLLALRALFGLKVKL